MTYHLTYEIGDIIDKEKILQTHPCLGESRPEESHKGTFGTVGIIGGRPGMMGAPYLAGKAALKMGCGKVILGFNCDGICQGYSDTNPELIYDSVTNILTNPIISAWVVGCGLGVNKAAIEAVDWLWANSKVPVVYDADALRILAAKTEIDVISNPTDKVFTPHPGEAAILLKNNDVQAVQSDRRTSASSIAQTYQAFTVLKGHHSLIASIYGKTWENTSGNAGLATAGSGDVLAGMIGSLIAQGAPAIDALRAAVWLHGVSAEVLAANGIGPIGLTASEIIDCARAIRNYLAAKD